jgi:hypothetical protein
MGAVWAEASTRGADKSDGLQRRNIRGREMLMEDRDGVEKYLQKLSAYGDR